jgi:hypothetical protein
LPGVEEPKYKEKGKGGDRLFCKREPWKSQTRRFTYFEQGVKETLPRLAAFSDLIINDGG